MASKLPRHTSLPDQVLEERGAHMMNCSAEDLHASYEHSLESKQSAGDMRIILLIIVVSMALPTGFVAADPPPALPAPAPRAFHRAIPFDGKIFVFGGGPDQQFLALDLEEQRWSQHRSPFSAILILTAVAGDRLYVLDPSTPELRSYDPENDAWTGLAAPPRARGNPSLVGYNGKLYLIGSYLNVPAEYSVEVYDPETDKWSTAPPLPEIEKEDHFHLTAVLGDKLHVVGHFFGGKSHWVFDGEKWEARAEAPVECGWKVEALEAAGDGLLLFKPHNASGGEVPEKPGEIFRYDGKEDRWESLGSLPRDYPIIFGASAFADGQIYVLGGVPDRTAVFRYDVADGTWERSAKGKAK